MNNYTNDMEIMKKLVSINIDLNTKIEKLERELMHLELENDVLRERVIKDVV